MTTRSREQEDAAVITAFLAELLRDRRAGAIRPLAAYRDRYPGFEGVIEREYETLTATLTAPEPGSSDARGGRPDGGDADAVAGSPDRDGRDDHDADGGGLGEQVAEDDPDLPSDRYRDARPIGRGGMGTILAVWDDTLERTIAMKVINRAIRRDRSSLARFLHEAKVTARLDHPGIVPVHDLGCDRDGCAYFTMPLVQGRDLREIIRLVHGGGREWTRARALEVVLRACDAVSYAHSRGVIHCDLKPANIMVGEFGETYVMDWGLARELAALKREAPRQSEELAPGDDVAQVEAARAAPRDRRGDVVGTPAYMAPEQARGEVDCMGPATDQYAIGAILYHLLSGEVPYGEHASSRRVLELLVEGAPRPLAAIAPDAPPELVAICARAMERDPQRRYESVRDLGVDLRAYLESRVVRAYRTGALAELYKWVLRNRAFAVACAVAVLGLALALVVSIVQRGRVEQQARRADAHLQAAFESIEDMIRRAASGTPEAVRSSAREELLRSALAITHAFLQSQGDEPAVRSAAARAWTRAASLQRLLGDYDQALESIRRARALLDDRLAREPSDAGSLEELVTLHTTAGHVHHGRGEHEQATQAFRAAVESADRLLGLRPGAARYRWWRAVAIGNEALPLQALGRVDAAVERLREGIAESSALIAEHPDAADSPSAAINMRTNLAFILKAQERWAEAEAEYEAAGVELTRLAAGRSHDRELQRSHGALLNGLGLAQQVTRGDTTAAATFREAIAVRRVLVGSDPDVPLYHSDLSGSLNNLARALRASGDLDTARALVDEALTHGRRGLAKAGDVRFLRYTANQLELSATILLELGEVDRAVARAAELATVELPDQAHTLAAVRLLARGAAAQPARSAELAARAIAILEQLLADGFRDLDALWHEGFDPLRTHAGFESVLARLAQGRGRPRDDRELAGPVESLWVTGQTAAELGQLTERGYSICDVELEELDPLRFAATLLRDDRADRRRSIWRADVTATGLGREISEQKLRIADLVAWRAGDEVRLAAVLVDDDGGSARSWSWFVAERNAGLEACRGRGERIIALAPHRAEDGSGRLWSFVTVRNDGPDRRVWKLMRDATEDAVRAELAAGWRAWAIDREAHDDELHVVLVQGPPFGAEVAFGRSVDEVRQLCESGRRVVAFTSYRVGAGPGEVGGGRRYDVVTVPSRDWPGR